MARAMLHADATVVIPMDVLRVPLTAAAGWLIYSERLDLFTVLGAALILTGNLLNLKPNPSTKASAQAEFYLPGCDLDHATARGATVTDGAGFGRRTAFLWREAGDF